MFITILNDFEEKNRGKNSLYIKFSFQKILMTLKN